MKDLNRAAKRILEAAAEKEKIVLFGDSDLDGVASVIIMEETLRELGSSPFFVFFANREKFGYGLNPLILKKTKIKGPGLMVVFDSGTSNFQGLKIAEKLKFKVIIVDHHRSQFFPRVEAIVNPHQPDDDTELKEICAAGLTYYLAKKIFSEAQIFFPAEKFLELAALATLYDQMPLKGPNERIVAQGLMVLPQTNRPGLKALFELNNCCLFDKGELQQKIISVLSSGKYYKFKDESYFLLTAQTSKKSVGKAKKLIKQARAKRQKIEEIVREVKKEAHPLPGLIFKGSGDWPLNLLGAAASRLSDFYNKPVFLYRYGRQCQGSVRAPKGNDVLKMMSFCKDFLLNWGGHPQAGGFGLEKKNLEEFKKCLVKHNF